MPDIDPGGIVDGLAIERPLSAQIPEQLTREALERVNRKKLPVSREELEKAVTNRLIQRILR